LTGKGKHIDYTKGDSGKRGGFAMKEQVRQIISALKDDSALFRLFAEEELAVVAPYFEEAHFKEGSLVFSEGDPPDFLALVQKGKVEIKKQTEFKGKQIVLAYMTKGSVLGELAVFDDFPRSASVEAVEDTDLLILRNEAMESFIEDHPGLGIKLLKGVSRVLSLRLRQLAERLLVIF
jgi:CRP-like cAMP-binding protein